MGLLDRIEKRLDRFLEEKFMDDGRPSWNSHTRIPAQTSPERGPRRLADDDIEAFMHAAEDRPGPYGGRQHRVSRTTRDQFLADVRRMYPLRLRRLERDLQWLRRRAHSYGLDPDEVQRTL